MGIVFAPSAKVFLDSMPHNIRSKIIDDVVWLADNQRLAPDNPQIVPFLMAPAIGKIFMDGCNWIIFYNERERLVIANVGSILEEPHLWRKR